MKPPSPVPVFAVLAVFAPGFVAVPGCRKPQNDAAGPTPTAAPPPQAPSDGAHHAIDPAALPPPHASPDADNPPNVVPRPEGAELRLPAGFRMAVWAEGGFERPRWLAGAPNGDVFLADADADTVFLLRDTKHAGVADVRMPFVTKLNKPFGMAIHGGFFYVANTNGIVRWPYAAGATHLDGPGETIATLPGRGYREHWTRNIVFRPDGAKLYVTVGSASNDDPEPEPRASILEMDPDGKNLRTFASGTRNPIGLVFHSATGKLWAAVQERDRLGDDLVPDYVTEVKEGGFYGWPFAYAGPNADPNLKGAHPELVAKTVVPDVLLQAHSAVLGLAEVPAGMFPEAWRGDLVAALHGSWNRTRRTGYALVRIPMQSGRPKGGYDDFVSGWMLGEDRKEVWGRPVGLLFLTDGSLLVVDDGANVIWRVTYAP